MREVRAVLAERLRARRPEIEEAALARVRSVADPSEVSDPEYLDGLRQAVGAAVDYGLAGIECGERRSPPIPPLLLDQARLAARNGISLDTVLRRYFAGYTLLGDFVSREVEGDPSIQGQGLNRLLREQASLFDRLIAAIGEAHEHEASIRPRSQHDRRAELVQRLIDSELVDSTELEYDFDAPHRGLVATGPGTTEALRKIARRLDLRLLMVERHKGVVWAWLSSARLGETAELDRMLASAWPSHAVLSLGECARGLVGWRLSHRQAGAALPIARRRPGDVTRYADVALLASVLQDDVLLSSLDDLYLEPLQADRDRGAGLRETLRAYFAAERNVSATAAALGVSRNTITSRLRAVEERLGHPLSSRAAELELALRVEDLSAAEAVAASGG